MTTTLAKPETLKYFSHMDAPVTQGTVDSAGLDLRASVSIALRKGETYDLHTGVHVEIPDGHFGMLVPRSSTGKKGLRLLNTIGIIDSDYRGEIVVCCENVRDDDLVVEQGDRIAQLVILPYAKVSLSRVSSIEELTQTQRGGAGFGSTGVK